MSTQNTEQFMTTATDTHTQAVPFADLKLSDLPSIGAPMDGQGGIFAGLVRGENDAPDYLLILGPEYDGELSWQQAMDWAAGLQVSGYQEFSLPNRSEHAVLFGNLRDQFQREWYWSSTQRAEGADFAWSQYFGYGYQLCIRKFSEFRARAVRRLVIR
jgi:hypothetical protein